jgi:predicted RNA-binding Zn-ribbon protein involved in translation (DUF1610 family)
MHIGSGAADIVPGTDVMVTYKCPACGAEVVVDTADSLQARCHWCRNTLSVNDQIPNGAVPDVVLPFKLTKDKAEQSIRDYVGRRKFFANKHFRAEFAPENIMGVYLPYMVVDANTHAHLNGEGEVQTGQYSIQVGKVEETRYNADSYSVSRDFDMLVDDLTVEAEDQYLDQDTAHNSNNVINAIMPFPTEDAVKFNANFLRGFTSEKRDANIDELTPLVDTQIRDIARYQARGTVSDYDRGVRWDDVQVQYKGQLWKTAYLPIWLYSYQEVKPGGRKLLHYVACNGVTGETVGSVPVRMSRLLAIAGVPFVVGIALMVVGFLL